MTTPAFQCVYGDLRTPLGRILTQGDKALDLASKTVEFTLYPERSTTVAVAWTSTGVTVEPTFTFTATAATDRLTAAEHGLADGAEVMVSSSTTLPAGLAASQRYYVRDARPNDFRLAETLGGDAVDVTGTGTGTHTCRPLGRVNYDFQTAHAAGRYRGRFRINESSQYTTFPAAGWIVIEIAPAT